MIIVVSPSFEDHCAGNKDPETDGGPSEQTHKPKGPSIKVCEFLWGWAVMLVLASPCLSSGKQSRKVTKHTHKHKSCKSNHSVRWKVGRLESGRPNRLCNLCRPPSSCTFTLVWKNFQNVSSIAFWLLHLERTPTLSTHSHLQSNMSASVGSCR